MDSQPKKKKQKVEIQVGQEFHRWTVIAPPESRLEHHGTGRPLWKRFALCRCQCGTERHIPVSGLTNFKSKSCGCGARFEAGNTYSRKHGCSVAREWRIWYGMVQRCYNPKSTSYPYYGGSGIEVCERWRESYENFIADMGPANGLTLERLRYADHYGPDNCEWATITQQRRNTSRNLMLEINGERKCLSAWCEQYGVPPDRTWKRINNGWPVIDALTIKESCPGFMQAGYVDRTSGGKGTENQPTP